MSPTTTESETTIDLRTASVTERLRAEHGDKRPMGQASGSPTAPHYDLLRRFKNELDLLIIFSTARCRYNCTFCDLPAKSTTNAVPANEIRAQFLTALERNAAALHVVDRATLSNEGSVLDESTFDLAELRFAVTTLVRLPGLSRIVVETRPEFITEAAVESLTSVAAGRTIDFLIGFETVNDHLRNKVLGKNQSRASLLTALDIIKNYENTAVTSYVLLKPDPSMSDKQGVAEAKATVRFLHEHASQRSIPAAVRVNPMYVAPGTLWAKRAEPCGFLPPRLTDALEVAHWAESLGIDAYLGLTSEGLADNSATYRSRDDFCSALLKQAIAFNHSPPAC